MQKRIRLKPFAISLIYITVCTTIVISLMTVGKTLLKNDLPVTYITSSTITEEVKPVVAVEKVFVRPYAEEDVKILQNFYDNNDTKDNQEKSLILYKNTYLQNSGVDYGREKEFNVLSIYPGKVIDIIEDDILGKIIQIEHSNNIIASYQCLNNINISKDDTVIEGQVIATSGKCNISKDIGNHIHLEVSKDGKMVNPELIFNKTINEL